MLRNQQGVIKRGAAKGLLFNTGSSHVGFLLGTFEPATQKIFQMLVKPGYVVYDIGANVGFLSLISARLVGPAGHVIAFEPLKDNVKQLERNAQLNCFQYLIAKNLAVSDRDGTALFLVSKSPTWGALASVSETVEDEIQRVDVEVARLDSVVQSDSLPLPNLMKIDVEGAEIEVLEGAMTTIRKAMPILIIELHGTNVAVAERLKVLNYFPVVVGSHQPITEVHWNAHVIAFPAPCAELTRIQNGDLG